MGTNKKMNELYVSKKITLMLQYRKKIRTINYIVVSVFGTALQMTAKLRAIRFPCEIPNFENIEIQLNNEFPTKSLIKKINKHGKI